jgi:hypothetical protein
VARINNAQPIARTQKLLSVISGNEVNLDKIAKSPNTNAIIHVMFFGAFSFIIPPKE